MKMLVVIFLTIFCGFTHGGQWSGGGGSKPNSKNSWSITKSNSWTLPSSGGSSSSYGPSPGSGSSSSYDTPSITKSKSWTIPSSGSSSGHGSSSYGPPTKYEGPLAMSPGVDANGAPLPVEDTPEVARLKQIHLDAISRAGGDIYPATGPDPWMDEEEEEDWKPSSSYLPQPSKGSSKWKRSAHYEEPYESPEEQYYAKLAHDAAVNKAKAKIAAALHEQKKQIQNSWSISTYAPKYTGPEAMPEGYDKTGAPLPVQDTFEVAQVKSKQLLALVKAGGDIYPAKHYPEMSTVDAWKTQKNDWPPQSSNDWPMQSSNDWPPQSSSKGWPMQSSNAWPMQSSNDWPPQSSSKGWPMQSSSNNAWKVESYAPSAMRYNGPIALPPGYDINGAPLPVEDTPEVAALKAKHLHTVAKIAEERKWPAKW